MHDLAILAIIWVSVFLASFCAHKTRLTPVLWYLFFGALMVNIGFLPEDMPVFIKDFSDLGIIIIMFALGFEEDNRNFVRSIKRSWGIALFGAIVPFAVAYSLALMFWENHNNALLCGLAMTATAVSLTMVSLKSEGLSKSPAATGIMTSAVLDDVASLALLAILIPVATGDAAVSVDGILLIVGKAVIFFLAVTFLGAWLFPISEGWIKSIPIISHVDLRKILSMGEGEYTILALMLIAVLVGLLAHEFGFHPAVGAYMGGLIINPEYFKFHEHRGRDFHKHAQEIIDNVAFTWIGPVFFVSLGTELLFDGSLLLEILPYALALFTALFIGQIASAALAARYTGGFTWDESLLIGFGMLGRAELAFLVMDIAYVQNKIMSTETFYSLMVAAFILNVSVPLTIRWWKANRQTTPT